MAEEAKEGTSEPIEVAEKVETEEEVSKPIAEEIKPEVKAESETEEEAAAPETEIAEVEAEKPEVEETLDEFLEEAPKTGEQKRIDKLTAEKYDLKARVEELEKGKPEEKKYSRTQLTQALKQALQEGDANLVMDVFDYSTEKIKKELRDEYLAEKKFAEDTVKQGAKEWTTIVDSYDYLSDPDEPELYSNARQELNIKNTSSLLYQISLALYNSKDDELFKYYHQAGGQKLAVADALAMILKKRRGLSPKDKEKDKLKKQLAKERRKKSLGGAGASPEEETPKKPMTDKESLDDYIKDRKKARAKASGDSLLTT